MKDTSSRSRRREKMKASLILEPPGRVPLVPVPTEADASPPVADKDPSFRSRHREKMKASLMLEPPGGVRLVPVTAEADASPAVADKDPAANDGHRWSRRGGRLAPWLIAMLGVLLYAHTLHFPFQFDDHIYLIGSPFVTNMGDFLFHRDFAEVANHSVTLGLGYDPSLNFILRPVAYLTFHLNYLADGFNPAGFRAVNVAVHAANGALVFLLLNHLLRRSPKSSSLPAGSDLFIPLTAALLFVVHPLHTQSVTYIAQRFTSMVCFFMLSSAYLHFLSLTARSRRSAMILRTLAVGATAAGMLTKESMFTAPLLIVMLHVVVLGGTLKRACWQALPHLLCMLIIPTLVLITTRAQTGGAGLDAALHIASSSKEPGYRYHYFLTQLGVVVEYVRLILWPVDLNVDREYTLATSPLQLRVWLPALVIAGALAFAMGLRRWKGDSVRAVLVSAAVLWYFLRLSVSSSFVPLDDLMVDHRTYGASLALLTAMACGLDVIRTRWLHSVPIRWSVRGTVVVAVATLAMATVKRNEAWQSELSLWQDAVEKSPGKARPWDNLGVCHHQAGRVDEALECLTKSAEVDPKWVPAFVKLSAALSGVGRYREATEWSRKGLASHPLSADLHYQLAVALSGMRRFHEAVFSLKNALRVSPSHVQSHAALGKLYRHLYHPQEALAHLKMAAALGSRDPEVTAAIEALSGTRSDAQAGL
ncbi:MAG: tetratricopeptide repeat protein [Roseimicrobium sp.]